VDETTGGTFDQSSHAAGDSPPGAGEQQPGAGQGEETVDPFDQRIKLAYPDGAGAELQLRITMGPGRLRIAPAADGASAWVTGTYQDPTRSIPLKVEANGAKARIAQHIDSVRLPRPRGIPTLDLQLGAGRTYALLIEGGANEIDAELGGLPLTRLDCRFGAGQARFRFGAPNPAAMERLHLTAGAAEVTATSLANANAAEISVEGGAAALHLDFGGTLARDAKARVNAGAAAVDVTVPLAGASKVAAHSVLAGVEIGDGFVTKEGAYWTPAAVAGQTPLLAIDVTVALAGLKIRAG
jgi:hypothetical protein